jgi:uncharacterized protein with HEPN domain
MNNPDFQRLLHIKVYCNDIAEFIKRFGSNYQSLAADSAYFHSVSMCLLQIGELANGLSEDFRESTAERIPWNAVRGMRNWIAHAYNDVDKEKIWATITEDIPLLLQFCAEFASNPE